MDRFCSSTIRPGSRDVNVDQLLVAGAAPGGGVREVREPRRVPFMDRRFTFGRGRAPVGRIAAWLQGLGLRARTRRDHDAELWCSTPIRACGRCCARYVVVERQSALHAARAGDQLKDSGAGGDRILENFAATRRAGDREDGVKHVVVASSRDLLGFRRARS